MWYKVNVHLTSNKLCNTVEKNSDVFLILWDGSKTIDKSTHLDCLCVSVCQSVPSVTKVKQFCMDLYYIWYLKALPLDVIAFGLFLKNKMAISFFPLSLQEQLYPCSQASIPFSNNGRFPLGGRSEKLILNSRQPFSIFSTSCHAEPILNLILLL